MSSRRRSLAAVSASVVVLGLTACSGGGAGGDDLPPAAEGPVELTYWTWAPGIEDVVDRWNEANPDITVTVNKQDGGDAAVTKLLTAIQGGSGAPDLMQAEYQKIPTLVSADALTDLAPAGAGELAASYPEASWQAVTLGTDAVYAIPQDTAPMMFYYRADVFDELGLDVPGTWEEYAEAARAVHEDDPDRYLGTFSANDAGWFAGLSQQAGASWWSVDGEAWGVDVDGEPTQRVAGYWGELVEEGVIDNQPMYTPEWNAALNEGDQVGWVSAVWAPGVLEGNAASTEGSWRAAPLPQWDADAPASGAWGGSATGVTSQSEHPREALEFTTWLNNDPEAVAALSETGLYPASTAGAEALTGAPEFFADQDDFWTLAAEAAEVTSPFTYGPNVNVAFSAYNDAFAEAARSEDSDAFLAAVGDVQQLTREDLERAGFTVR